jgi:hypothetical protein
LVADFHRGVRLLAALHAVQEIPDVGERRGQAAGKPFDGRVGRIPALVGGATARPGFIVDAISLFREF